MEIDKENELKNIGQRIKKVRMDKGLTQVDLSSLVNKDQQSIQRLEAGRVNPSYVYLLEICLGLEIDLKDIL